jgi:NAD(P)-dependent dehydrogenase (short-subunit alcohol dehydrogenase family)
LKNQIAIIVGGSSGLGLRQHVNAPEMTGRIVNMTSVDPIKAHPQNAHFAAAKAAIVSLTKSIAQECAKDQRLVNSVASAGFATAEQKNPDSPTTTELSAPACRQSGALIGRQTMPTPRRRSRPQGTEARPRRSN